MWKGSSSQGGCQSFRSELQPAEAQSASIRRHSRIVHVGQLNEHESSLRRDRSQLLDPKPSHASSGSSASRSYEARTGNSKLSPMESASLSLEEQRLENIKRNRALLKDISLQKSTAIKDMKVTPNEPARKRKFETFSQPSRSSARISSAPSKRIYLDPSDERSTDNTKARTNRSKAKAKVKQAAVEPQMQAKATIAIPLANAETLRAGWTGWKVTGSCPIRDEDATFHFSDEPLFLPNKSPEEMIREGCFGGSYFRPLYSKRLGIFISDDWRELPEEWTSGLDVDTWLTSSTYNPDINKYKVSCGQSIEEWEAAGWINHTYDVRGWFQWYCRFFMGRRCEDDERQISRWRKCVGLTGRWRRMLLKKYVTLGIREVFDDGEDEDQVDVSPVMHQTCAHWAFEVRQNVLDEYWRTGK